MNKEHKKCSRCENNAPPNRKYCLNCHAKYMREWRKTHPLSKEQKLKNKCRSYSGVYLKRGKIKKENYAVCGSEKSQIHHEDYSNPLNIIWLCRKHHLEHHKTLTNNS